MGVGNFLEQLASAFMQRKRDELGITDREAKAKAAQSEQLFRQAQIQRLMQQLELAPAEQESENALRTAQTGLAEAQAGYARERPDIEAGKLEWQREKDVQDQKQAMELARLRADLRPPSVSIHMPSGMTPSAESATASRLSAAYEKAAQPAMGLRRQLTLMETGLAAAKRGDMNAGQQAVLVTFQKMLDPASVVRESEYFRSAQGQALLARIEGAYTRLQQGGAGFTVGELEQFASLAREAVTGYDMFLKAKREQIGKVADRYQIPREIVIPDYDFGGANTSGGGDVVEFVRDANGKLVRKR